MPLSNGTLLGPYEIVAPIGVASMGEVYRAHHPRMGRDILRYTKPVVKQRSDGRPKAVSSHVWRHSTAVQLLEAGVEVNVIRAWLGHASLETTNRYAEITIRTKQAALDKRLPPGTAEKRIPRRPLWQTAASPLDWLQSLYCDVAESQPIPLIGARCRGPAT